jgi:GPH family glycoside/pentoside/hexuronide:cation symporter
MDRNTAPRLPAAALFSYALPAAGTGFLFALMLVVYLNYAIEVIGVSASAVGAVFFAARVWDAVCDPLAGYWSDRTHSRLGRRKSWLLAACPALLVFAVAAWAPPRSLAGAALVAWITVAVFGFYTAYTLFEVPHMALGAELTQERRDRVRLFAARQFVRTLGLFGAFGLGASLLEDLATARERLAMLAGGAGVFSVLSIVWAIAALPRERPDYAGRGPSNSWRAARDVWRNRDARLLLFVYGIEQLGIGGIGVLVPFVVRHVLRKPDLIAEMLLCYTAPALLSVPFWMWLGERFDKRALWMRAMGLSGIGFGMLLFLGEGTVALMVAASLIAGCASGCAPTLGQALKADLIDRDELATGERKEGAYFAAWNLVSKLASGVMIGLVGFALDLSGFVAGVEEQSAAAIRTMVFLCGGMPVLGFAVGMWLFRGFGLTQDEHARVLAALSRRAPGSVMPEPPDAEGSR